MKNIVLLGSKGKVGNAFLIKNKNIYNIYSDLDYKINNLLCTSFLIKKDIDFIVNCIGSTKNKSLFFHSNFFIQYIVGVLKEFSLVSKKNYLDSLIIN